MPVANVLEVAHAPITSPIALFEAVLGICRKRHASVEEAEENVREFLDIAGIELIPITAREAETALSAFSRYGKDAATPPRSSTLAIALLTRRPRTTAGRFCSRATISTRLTFAQRLAPADTRNIRLRSGRSSASSMRSNSPAPPAAEKTARSPSHRRISRKVQAFPFQGSVNHSQPPHRQPPHGCQPPSKNGKFRFKATGA
jgi:hypothetical protein